MNFTQIGFMISTDYMQKTRKKEINLRIPNIEVMANPIQIKVVSRFALQILEFKRMLDIIIDELKGESIEKQMNKTLRKNKD
jgi:hypothetical protein